MGMISEIIMRITGRADVKPAMQQVEKDLKGGFQWKNLIKSEGIGAALRGGIIGVGAAMALRLSRDFADAWTANGETIKGMMGGMWDKFTGKSAMVDEIKKADTETRTLMADAERVRIEWFNRDLSNAVTKLQQAQKLTDAITKGSQAVTSAQGEVDIAKINDPTGMEQAKAKADLEERLHADATAAAAEAIQSQREELRLMEQKLAKEKEREAILRKQGWKSGGAADNEKKSAEATALQIAAKKNEITIAEKGVDTEMAVGRAMKDRHAAEMSYLNYAQEEKVSGWADELDAEEKNERQQNRVKSVSREIKDYREKMGKESLDRSVQEKAAQESLQSAQEGITKGTAWLSDPRGARAAERTKEREEARNKNRAKVFQDNLGRALGRTRTQEEFENVANRMLNSRGGRAFSLEADKKIAAARKQELDELQRKAAASAIKSEKHLSDLNDKLEGAQGN